MMAQKARLFGDAGIHDQILASPNPGKAKALGRSVRGFDEAVWHEHRERIAVEGNTLKFDQNPALRTYLLATGKRVLVEASPVDRIWGIGREATHPGIENPAHWDGENLLGFALMEARSILAKDDRARGQSRDG